MPIVRLGDELKKAADFAGTLEKRDSFERLSDFFKTPPEGTMCILFGLRRTGKSMMMLQAAGELDADSFSRCAYIVVRDGECMGDILDEMHELHDSGREIFFIDEITKAHDFTRAADDIANSFSLFGSHVVLAGTDSLKFRLAETNLLGRTEIIKTTRIPFREQSRLFPGLSFSDYSKIGGVLAKESVIDDFFSQKSDDYLELRKRYTYSSISENIQNSLRSVSLIWPGLLAELCQRGEMASIINYCVHHDSHQLLMDVMNREFKSEDVRTLVQELRSEYNDKILRQACLNNASLAKRHKEKLSIVELQDRTVKIDQKLLDEVEGLLYDIHAMVPCDIYEFGEKSIKRGNHNVFTQSAVRWGQIDALFEIAREVASKSSLEIPDRIFERAFMSVHGKILEDALFLETLEHCGGKGKCDVFKFRADRKEDECKGEIDIVIALPDKKGFAAYEVKRHAKPDSRDARHLKNPVFIEDLERNFGPLLDRAVICPCGTDATRDEAPVGKTMDAPIRHRDIDRFVLEELPDMREWLEDRASCLQEKAPRAKARMRM